MSSANISATRDPGRHRDKGIALIAAFKFVKALLLLGAAFAAVGIVHIGVGHFADRVLSMVSSGTDRRVTQSLLSRLGGMSPARIEALGIGAFLYSALFFVEGVGLWMQRRWAEYLTIISTASFVPFEIYELMRDVTAVRIGTLVLNVAIVIYLIVRLRHRREQADVEDPRA